MERQDDLGRRVAELGGAWQAEDVEAGEAFRKAAGLCIEILRGRSEGTFPRSWARAHLMRLEPVLAEAGETMYERPGGSAHALMETALQAASRLWSEARALEDADETWFPAQMLVGTLGRGPLDPDDVGRLYAMLRGRDLALLLAGRAGRSEALARALLAEIRWDASDEEEVLVALATGARSRSDVRAVLERAVLEHRDELSEETRRTLVTVLPEMEATLRGG